MSISRVTNDIEPRPPDGATPNTFHFDTASMPAVLTSSGTQFEYTST